jgi:23S rRNA U2552 (ribose-2'-O)-methylase RlmE/FtsJ
MSLMKLSPMRPATAVAPLKPSASRPAEAVALAATAAGVAAVVGVVVRTFRGASDEDVLRRMRARRTLLKEARPDASGARHVERVGGPAPRRRGV